MGTAVSNPLMKVDHADVRRKSIIFVDWMIGNACNYSCSYCPRSLHDGSQQWVPAENIEAFAKHIADLAKLRNKTVYLQLAGGEVTMIPYFVETLGTLRESGIKTIILSNASRSGDWWLKARNFLDEVVLTFHPERADFDHFKSIVDITSAKICTHINVAAPPAHFDQAVEVADQLSCRCRDITITLKPMLIGFGETLYPYSPSQMAILRQRQFKTEQTRIHERARGELTVTYFDGSTRVMTASQFVTEGINRWKNWTCNIGLELLCIKPSGDIFRGECLVGGKLGNIEQGTQFSLPDAHVTCTKSMCSCLLDIMTTRRREDEPGK